MSNPNQDPDLARALELSKAEAAAAAAEVAEDEDVALQSALAASRRTATVEDDINVLSSMHATLPGDQASFMLDAMDNAAAERDIASQREWQLREEKELQEQLAQVAALEARGPNAAPDDTFAAILRSLNLDLTRADQGAEGQHEGSQKEEDEEEEEFQEEEYPEEEYPEEEQEQEQEQEQPALTVAEMREYLKENTDWGLVADDLDDDTVASTYYECTVGNSANENEFF